MQNGGPEGEPIAEQPDHEAMGRLPAGRRRPERPRPRLPAVQARQRRDGVRRRHHRPLAAGTGARPAARVVLRRHVRGAPRRAQPARVLVPLHRRLRRRARLGRDPCAGSTDNSRAGRPRPSSSGRGLADGVGLRWSTPRDDVGVTGYDVIRNGVVIGTTAGDDPVRGRERPGRHRLPVRHPRPRRCRAQSRTPSATIAVLPSSLSFLDSFESGEPRGLDGTRRPRHGHHGGGPRRQVRPPRGAVPDPGVRLEDPGHAVHHPRGADARAGSTPARRRRTS